MPQLLTNFIIFFCLNHGSILKESWFTPNSCFYFLLLYLTVFETRKKILLFIAFTYMSSVMSMSLWKISTAQVHFFTQNIQHQALYPLILTTLIQHNPLCGELERFTSALSCLLLLLPPEKGTMVLVRESECCFTSIHV